MGAVNAIALQSDGNIVIGGAFTNVAGAARKHAARLKQNGALDSSFSPPLSDQDSVSKVAIQRDYKIVLAGHFQKFNGFYGLMRLNTNGTKDAPFNFDPGNNYSVTDLALQPDQKVLVSGLGMNRVGLIRLETNGTPDATFNPTLPFYPGQGTGGPFALQWNTNIIASFTFMTSSAPGQYQIYFVLLRLDGQGNIDPSFTPPAYGQLSSIKSLPDGRILLSDGRGVDRLNANGTPDSAFRAHSLPPKVTAIEVQEDGKIIVAGPFKAFSGFPQSGIARLNGDGTLDTNFSSGTGLLACLLLQWGPTNARSQFSLKPRKRHKPKAEQ